MSHIERKKIRGRIYLYRYQSYRDENGRVKKRFIKYLGPECPVSVSGGSAGDRKEGGANGSG